MWSYLVIGPSPANEDCAQLGDEAYKKRALREIDKFRELIRKVIGPEPPGAELVCKSEKHDFGTYYELNVKYNGEDKEAVDYAYLVEEHAPAGWEESLEFGKCWDCGVESESLTNARCLPCSLKHVERNEHPEIVGAALAAQKRRLEVKHG